MKKVFIFILSITEIEVCKNSPDISGWFYRFQYFGISI